MSKISHPSELESEERLVALLATLRVEPTEEADFESRFLHEFHERVAREAVCCPARRHVFAHLLQMLSNFGRGKIAFGSSVLAFGVLAVAYSFYPTEQTGGETTAFMSRERQTSPLLFPALSSDLDDCTTIRVKSGASTFEVGGVTIIRGQHSTVIEVPNVLPAQPRQNGNVSLPASSVRYAF